MNQHKRFAVRVLTAAEAVTSLPGMQDFDGRSDPIDIYIQASGFEERVLAVPNAFVQAGTIIRGPILLGRYRTNPEDNARREAELTPILDALGAGDFIPFDADSPEGVLSAITAAMEGAAEGAHVGFDISGASSTLILSVIASLIRSEKKMRLSIFYATAKKYHEPSELEREHPVIKWGESGRSESGVSEVEVNELYPGCHHDHLPTFVIALPSTAPARMKRCLGYLGIEPLNGTEDRVHWILPSTDNEEHKWRQRAVMQAVLDVIHGESRSSDDGQHDSVCLAQLPEGLIEYSDVGNYRECVRALIERIDAGSGRNIYLVHLGTKIQGIGVALALAARQEVTLVSARPQAFAASTYSEGVGRIFSLMIDDPVAVVRHLSAIGTLSVVAK